MRIKRHVIVAALALGVTANAAAQSGDAIDEIIVEGQKIKRSLQDTKESVAIFDEDLIAEQSLFDLSAIFNQTANAFELFNGEDFGIRGVTASSASTGGGSGELGALFYDGVALTGFARRFGPRALWDVQRVEILRGPQSTNVGRNAVIGAVVMTSNAPDPSQFDSSIRVEAGNYGRLGFEGMVNVPISDIAAFRFTAEQLNTNGFTENQTIPDDEFDARENQTFRGRFLISPSDQLSIGITAQYAETKRGQQIIRADLIDNVEDRINLANLPGSEDFEAWSGSLNIDYALSDTWSVTSVTAFLEGDYSRFDDDDEGPGAGNAFRAREGVEDNWSQELRFTYNGDRLQGVAGLWYTDVDVDNDTLGLVNLAPADLGVPGILLPFYPPTLEIDVFIPATISRSNAAFFTEWDYAVNDQWTLSAGVRYDYEELDQLTNTISSLAPGSELPDPATAGMIADMLQPGSGPAVTAGITQVNGLLQGFLQPTDNPTETTDYNAWLPQFGATYDVTEDISLSAFYKRGYRAGGSGIALTGGDVFTFEPEFLDNFEVSLRSSWLNDRLTVNANAYVGDWTDQQVLSCPNGPLSCVTTNAGESEIYGVELETQYSINDRASMYTSLGYARTEFSDFVDNEQDLSGNDFALSPRLTGSIGGAYSFTDNIAVTGSVTFQDKSWADIQNAIRLDSRALLNLNARYTGDNYSVTLYGRNLTDEFYIQSDFTDPNGAQFLTPGFPREYGVQFQYDF